MICARPTHSAWRQPIASILVTDGRCGRSSITQMTAPPTISAAATACTLNRCSSIQWWRRKPTAAAGTKASSTLAINSRAETLARGAPRQIEQLAAVVPEDREDGAELDEDLERGALGVRDSAANPRR